uniref:Replication protein A 32 kDa subunit n=1 Tax=Timema shepardi TaxID=629360 RepID=A0A7R9G6Y7_TIMSH|nr:unnamed protein product [Timema shepardi]
MKGFGGEQGGGGGFLNTSSQFSSPSDGNQQEKKVSNTGSRSNNGSEGAGHGYNPGGRPSPPSFVPGMQSGTRRAQNVVPVTIKQLLNSPEEGLKIGELDVHLVSALCTSAHYNRVERTVCVDVTVVGVIRSVVADSMKVTYLLDDDTGVISVHNWVDADSVRFVNVRLFGVLSRSIAACLL